jgi:hypothetical protein
MEVDRSSGVMVEMVQYTNMQEPNSSPKGDRRVEENARYAGKAMDGVIRKNQDQASTAINNRVDSQKRVESRLQLAREGHSPEKCH